MDALNEDLVAARSLEAQDRPDDAIRAYERGYLYRDERPPWVLLEIARLHRQQRRPKEAIVALGMYLSLAPNAPDRAKVEALREALTAEYAKTVR